MKPAEPVVLDSFAIATGLLDCAVLTGDPEFEAIEKAGIRVTWL